MKIFLSDTSVLDKKDYSLVLSQPNFNKVINGAIKNNYWKSSKKDLYLTYYLVKGGN